MNNDNQYTYFISYWFKVGANTGMNNGCITLDSKLDTMDEVCIIEQKIKDQNNLDIVTVINFQPLSVNITKINSKPFGEY